MAPVSSHSTATESPSGRSETSSSKALILISTDGVVLSIDGAPPVALFETPRRRDEPLGESVKLIVGDDEVRSFSRDDDICKSRRDAASSAGGDEATTTSPSVEIFVVDDVGVGAGVDDVDVADVDFSRVFDAARESAESAINGRPVIGSNEIPPSDIFYFYMYIIIII